MSETQSFDWKRNLTILHTVAEPISISCSAELSNVFTRGQHTLERDFGLINGLESTWAGLIPDGGRFPTGSGFAARVTTLGQQRLTFSRLNNWQDMVGLQADCAVSCDPPVQTLEFANADHKWYRLAFQAYNTKPYCLESMFADALNLPAQIQQIYRDLKMVQSDTRDEFSRNNHAAISANRWVGTVHGTTGVQDLKRQAWRFATDANGNIDTTYIILDSTIDPDDISLMTVAGVLNRIRNRGTYIGTFPKDGNIRLITDYETFQDLPLYDTNVRADNRFRAPTVLNPAYAATTEYAGYSLHNDPFSLRYYWTEVEPGYPDGVLKRIDQWSSVQFSEGCFSDLSSDYENADFQVSFPFGRASFQEQNGMQPTSVPNASFAATAQPWQGAWRWLNEINEITPCNVDRNKGFWRAVFKMAAKPLDSGIHGHAVLHKRFPYRGITKVCRPLGTPVGGSVDCTLTCPPLDLFPPALVDVATCGSWNPDSCSSVG